MIDEDDEYVPEQLFATPAAAVESLQAASSSSRLREEEEGWRAHGRRDCSCGSIDDSGPGLPD